VHISTGEVNIVK